MPDWVQVAFSEYQKRLTKEVNLFVTDLELPKHSKNSSAIKRKAIEGENIRKVLDNKSYVIVMDVLGKQYSTEKLASKLEAWLSTGKNISVVVGGPDGLDPSIIEAADEIWSLSQLTFPHTIVRVLLAEQFYRAWSITQNHPYHRA